MKDQIKLIIISPRTHERLSTVFMKILQPLNDEAACTFCTIGVEKNTPELRNLKVIDLGERIEFEVKYIRGNHI